MPPRTLLAIGCLAAGFIAAMLWYIDYDWNRVNPSEQAIADRIEQLGGAYNSREDVDRHITSVVLTNTTATDADVEVMLGLSHLKYLDFENCDVSDAVIPKLLGHPTLRLFRPNGTLITKKELYRALRTTTTNAQLEDHFRPRVVQPRSKPAE